MAFERSDGLLGLGLGGWTSKRGRVLGVEPDAAVAVEQPVAEAPGIAQLRLEGPAVDSPIDQFGAAVLPGGSDDSQTHAEESLLFPTGELLHGHGWSAQQVDGEAEGSVEQTRAVGRGLCTQHRAFECAYGIRQRGGEVGGASEEAQSVVETDDGNAVTAGGTSNRDGAAEVEASVVVAPGERDPVGMDGEMT